jgi:hypothetical protein
MLIIEEPTDVIADKGQVVKLTCAGDVEYIANAYELHAQKAYRYNKDLISINALQTSQYSRRSRQMSLLTRVRWLS